MKHPSHTLLIRLVAPMQSWGTRSQFDDRDSENEPTKSGVLGLCAAALGIDRHDPIDHLTRLQFGVRVDRAGQPRTDFHTADSGKKNDVTRRIYLSDAAFWAGLSGDLALLKEIHEALRTPRWSLSLGRKAFIPSLPVWFEGALQDSALIETLRSAPSLKRKDAPNTSYTYVVEKSAVQSDTRLLSPSFRRDQPTAPFAMRQYGLREVWIWNETPTPSPEETS